MADSSDFEVALISRIIEDKDIQTAIKQKITPDFFFDPLCRAAYVFLIGWYNNPKYTAVPSWESFTHSFPGFEPNLMEEAVVAICDKVREAKVYSDMSLGLARVGDMAATDPIAAFHEMQRLASHLTAEHSVDQEISLESHLQTIRQGYEDMKSGKTGGLKGKAYPYPALNEATLGALPGQLITVYGRPKSGKTNIALNIAYTWQAAGDKGLIFSQELTSEEVAQRYVALTAAVHFGKFLRGQLDDDAEAAFYEVCDSFAENPPVVIGMLEQTGEAALLELEAKIDEHRPDYVVLDAMYFLADDWKMLAIITRGLKRIARIKRVKILITTQANRTKIKGRQVGEGADDVAYGDSAYQDSDLVLRITSDIENRKNSEVLIETAAIRNGTFTAFKAHMKLYVSMGQKEVVVDPSDPDVDFDAEEAIEKDIKDAEENAEDYAPDGDAEAA